MAAVNLRRLLYLKYSLIIRILLRRRRKKLLKYRKRFWVRHVYAERKQKGEYYQLVKDLQLHDHEYFFKYFRMSPASLELLLSWVAPVIKKETTRMREAIPPGERLCVALRYLVTGDAQSTIAANYRMSPAVVGRIIKETCEVLWTVLIEKGFLKVPSTEEDWIEISKTFEQRWNFPNALGAIDGKHVVMQAPAKSGSTFFNYKKTHSIVLMAVCNAKYEFTLVDIGDSGRQSDGSVYANSHLGHAIECNKLNIPKPAQLPNSDKVLPYVFVGDDAFGLKMHMMKPFPFQNLSLEERIFNYRLSRTRRIIENVFGIATSRFRIFRRPIIAKVETVASITKAVVVLHNFLMSLKSTKDKCSYCPSNYVDQDGPTGISAGLWRREASELGGLQPINNMGSNNYSLDARHVRDAYKEYFNAEGAVGWQWDLVTRIS